jgi:hypothetical protein
MLDKMVDCHAHTQQNTAATAALNFIEVSASPGRVHAPRQAQMGRHAQM